MIFVPFPQKKESEAFWTSEVADYLAAILIFFGRADSALGRRRVSKPSVICASAFGDRAAIARQYEACGETHLVFTVTPRHLAGLRIISY